MKNKENTTHIETKKKTAHSKDADLESPIELKEYEVLVVAGSPEIINDPRG